MRGKLWFGVAAAALMAFGMAPSASAQDGDQPGDASTTATLSGNVDGEFSPAGDVDWFRLHVEQGQRYSLALAGIEDANGQAVDPMLGIYDAQGNQLAFNDDANGSLNSALRYTPQSTGEVFVEARAFNSEATGRYRLGVSSETAPPDDVGNDASTRGRVAVGRTTTGNIESEGDVDSYRFSARTGNRYTVSLAGTGAEGGLGDPLLRVVDAEGNELASNDDSEGSLNSQLEFIPRSNGNVFIEARGYGDGYTGAYTLNVTQARMPRDNISNSTLTGSSIRAGQTIDGVLDFPTDSDWFRIRLQEGQSYRFTLNSAGDSALGDPLLKLHNSRGEEVAMDDDGGDGLNSYLEFTAPSTGTYYVEARGFGDEATGGYALTANAGDVPDNTETDASLSADGDYREGVLSPAGDHDWYRIDLNEGQGIRVALNSAEGADALGDPLVVLHGPDGAEIARDDDGGEGLNAWLEYVATAAGPYYIEARGFVDDAAGRYAISVTAGEIGGSMEGAEPLSSTGDPRISSINGAGDVDWFVIELVEGRSYRFNLEGVGEDPLADPLMTLYDSTGEQVAQDDDGGRGTNSYLNFASPTGGPYFVGVSSFTEGGAGRYQLRVSDTDVPGHAYTDELLDSTDDSRASRIEMPGDVDAYRVTLEAGVTYQIEVNARGASPLSDPFVALIQEGVGNMEDAAIVRDGGQRVASDNNSGGARNARLRYRPTASGDFLVQVSGVGRAVGDYEVKIVRR